MLSAQECIVWAVIYVTECVAIVTLNAITIATFMKNPHLRKRSMYLVLNLAVADMFVGFTGMYTLYELGTYCFLWRDSLDRSTQLIAQVLRQFFTASSLINITNISIERLHATFFPFKHRFVKKFSYWMVIAVSYLLAALLSSVAHGLVISESLETTFCVLSSFSTVFVVFIVLCYSLILIRVRCSPHPRLHVEVRRERKLTVTLFLVTSVSILMWVPYIVQSFLWFTTPIFRSWPSHLTCFVIMLLGANSLVNPLLYVIRMQEFKTAVKKLFCGHTGVQDLPLQVRPQRCP